MSEQPVTAPYVFDPFQDGFAEDPYPEYERLRRLAPVHEHPLGFWVLSRYDDVRACLRSSASVNEDLVGAGTFRETVSAAYDGRSPRMHGLSMLDQDPPTHTRLRRLVSKVFSARAIARLEHQVVDLTDQALDRLGDAGGGDLVSELAFPLPFAVISEMLGTPPVDTERLRSLTGALVTSLEPVADPVTAADIVRADDELLSLGHKMIAWKRRHPGEDLLTALVEAEEDGDVLGDDELVAQVLLLYVAGHETTVNLIGGGTLALLRHPEQLDRLRRQPGLVPGAVEELLRFESPVQLSRRVTTEPTAVDGRVIEPGTFVMLCLAAANRDPQQWGADAGQLVVDRPDAREHVSFGSGVHHCLGAALARLEGRVVLGRLLDRFPSLELAGPVSWNGRMNLRGPAVVPVSV